MAQTKADRIEALLDADCDETRVALYNPRSTIAAIRAVLAEPESISVDDALSVLNRDYFDDVRGIAEDCKRAVKDDKVSNDEELSDYLHQSIDGHERVIYAYQARIGLVCTDSVDAYEDETGEKPPSPEVQMFWALMQDVRDRLGDFDSIKAEIENDRDFEELKAVHARRLADRESGES